MEITQEQLSRYRLLKNVPILLRSSFSNDDYSFFLVYDSKSYKTHLYDSKILTVRRDTSFYLRFLLNSGTLDSSKLSVKIVTVAEFIEKSIALSDGGPSIHGFSFTVDSVTDGRYCVGKVSMDDKTPVGYYTLQMVWNETSVSEKISFFVVFNPFSSRDLVRAPVDIIKEHLIPTRTHVFCGSLDNNQGKRYELAQVNSNDDGGIVTGNWGSDFKGGKPPTSWNGAEEVFDSYLLNKISVRYGQCYLFAIVLLAKLRCIGFCCRALSMFPSTHDVNKDGRIVRRLDADTLEAVSGSDTEWNFHVVVNAYIERPGLVVLDRDASCALNWQHLDPTPQTRSDGFYQCGPFPVELVRLGTETVGFKVPYDGEQIYLSINASVLYQLVDQSDNVVKEFTKKYACESILTSGPTGEKIEVVHQYRAPRVKESKPPSKKMAVSLDVPKEAYLTDKLEYSLKVFDAPENSPTVISLSVEIRDIRGNNVLKSSPPAKSFVFEESSITFCGKTEPFSLDTVVDISTVTIFWELKVFDKALEKLKVSKAYTSLLMSFEGKITHPNNLSFDKTLTISCMVRNMLALDIPDCTVMVKFRGSSEDVRQEVSAFPKRAEKSFDLVLPGGTCGVCKIELWIICAFCHIRLDTNRILII